MTLSRKRRLSYLLLGVSVGALMCVGGVRADDDHDRDAGHEIKTASPIKHVIIIVGENCSFDHLFATYEPKSRDEHVLQSAVRAHRQGGRIAQRKFRQGASIPDHVGAQWWKILHQRRGRQQDAVRDAAGSGSGRRSETRRLPRSWACPAVIPDFRPRISFCSAREVPACPTALVRTRASPT